MSGETMTDTVPCRHCDEPIRWVASRNALAGGDYTHVDLDDPRYSRQQCDDGVHYAEPEPDPDPVAGPGAWVVTVPAIDELHIVEHASNEFEARTLVMRELLATYGPHAQSLTLEVRRA